MNDCVKPDFISFTFQKTNIVNDSESCIYYSHSMIQENKTKVIASIINDT